MTASADVKKALALHFECLYLRLSQYGLADSSHEFAAGQTAQVLAIAQRHFHRPAHAPVIGELVEALKGIKVWAASYCPQKDYDAADEAIAAGEAAIASGAVADADTLERIVNKIVKSPCHLGKREDAYILAQLAIEEMGASNLPDNAFVEYLKDAKFIVKMSPLFKKFIDGTPLENDIAVWMTEFAIHQIKQLPAAPATN